MSVGIREGTSSIMACGIHNFATSSTQEWEQHLREPGHFSIGFAPCALCGEQFTFGIEDRIPTILVMKGLATHQECVGKVKGV